MRDALGVKLALVTEGDRFEREDGFARPVHRFGLRLETLRRDDRAELAVGPNDDSDPCRHSHSTDAGDECSPLSSGRADADLRGFTGANAGIANVDIVTACVECDAGALAKRDVVVARPVESERLQTDGGVEVAGSVVLERTPTVGRVAAASCEIKERIVTLGGVLVRIASVRCRRHR